MLLSNGTWPQVEAYLKTEDLLLIPIGSTEQHGPTGLIGTDYITAQKMAELVGEKTQTFVAPPICYGMARHHLDFPGSASLAPSTFLQVIKDVVDSFTRHGFRRMIFINGHGGNMAPLTTAFSEIKDHDNDVLLKTINWFLLPEVAAYEAEKFGDQSGSHATCGEVAATMEIRPQAFEKIESQHFKVERPQYSMPMSPAEFRRTFPDGRMMSNPGLATRKHGEEIIEVAVNAIIQKIKELPENPASR